MFLTLDWELYDEASASWLKVVNKDYKTLWESVGSHNIIQNGNFAFIMGKCVLVKKDSLK